MRKNDLKLFALFFPFSLIWLVWELLVYVKRDYKFVLWVSFSAFIFISFLLAAISFAYSNEGERMYRWALVITGMTIFVSPILSAIIRDRFKVTHTAFLMIKNYQSQEERSLMFIDIKTGNNKEVIINQFNKLNDDIFFLKKNFTVEGSYIYNALNKQRYMLGLQLKKNDPKKQKANKIVTEEIEKLEKELKVIENSGVKTVISENINFFKKIEIYARYMFDAQKQK